MLILSCSVQIKLQDLLHGLRCVSLTMSLVRLRKFVLLGFAFTFAASACYVQAQSRDSGRLEAARTLDFLRSPPGNRLEALKGDRTGQWSIRINDQWRVCFAWTEAGPVDVEIVDYH